MSDPKKPVDYLQVAKNNLQIPNNITPEQYKIRVITAQAAATVALVEQQALANLLQARALGAFDTAEEYKATRDKIRELAGLPVSVVA